MVKVCARKCIFLEIGVVQDLQASRVKHEMCPVPGGRTAPTTLHLMLYMQMKRRREKEGKVKESSGSGRE